MLGRLFGSSETRAATFQQMWAAGDWPTTATWAGKRVDQDTALQISTVYACVRIYCDTISTLPVGVFRRENGTRRPVERPAWLSMPDIGVTWGNHLQQMMLSLLINGNAYGRVYRNDLGEPVAIVVLNPLQVEPQRRRDGTVVYAFDGGRTIINGRDMIHLTELVQPGEVKGVSRIDQVKNELGLAQALTEFASKFFANGSIVSGVIQTPANVTVEQAQAVKAAFEATHKGSGKSHGVSVIGGGGEFVKVSTAPDEAQMLESRAQAIEAIARVFRVPPPKLGITTPGSMSYASVEQLNQSWVQDSLMPYMAKIEEAYGWLLPQGQFLRINADALLRGDTVSRYGAYSQALQSGWAAVNDVRRLEDMPPVDGGDVVRVPLANVDLPAANVVETEKNVAMAVQLITAGADPAATLAAFGLPSIPWMEMHAEPMTQAADMSEDMQDPNEPADEAPTRTVRIVERDDDGNIVRIIDEEQ